MTAKVFLTVGLQAYIDDSASDVGNERLFLAGYVNTIGNWSLFSEAWADELRTAPKVDYLKMVEAAHLRGQFKNWTADARDEKLRGLVRVARHFQPLSFSVSVDRARYRELVRPFAPRGLGNPHFVACFAVVSIVAKYGASRRVKLPVQFIYDQQVGVDADIGLFFDYMARHLPSKARRLVAGAPMFKDDKECLPLQAADMLAWHIRREYEEPTNNRVRSIADALRNEREHVIGDVDDGVLQRLGDGFARQEGASEIRSKAQWRNLKSAIATLSAQGYEPPYGTWWKNLAYRLKAWFIN